MCCIHKRCYFRQIVRKGNNCERDVRKVEYNLTCKKSLTALNTTGSVARIKLTKWHSRHVKICGRYHIWMPSAAFEFLMQVTTIFMRYALDKVSPLLREREFRIICIFMRYSKWREVVMWRIVQLGDNCFTHDRRVVQNNNRMATPLRQHRRI